MCGLAGTQMARGQYREADALYRTAFELTEKSLGSKHPQTAGILSNLADLHSAQLLHIPRSDRLAGSEMENGSRRGYLPILPLSLPYSHALIGY